MSDVLFEDEVHRFPKLDLYNDAKHEIFITLIFSNRNTHFFPLQVFSAKNVT
jgi:hypothetical protein